jgi:hypothetical protein
LVRRPTEAEKLSGSFRKKSACLLISRERIAQIYSKIKKIIMFRLTKLSDNEDSSKKIKPTDDFGLVALGYIMLGGFFMMVIASITSITMKKYAMFLPVLGLSGVIALAALLVGGFFPPLLVA